MKTELRLLAGALMLIVLIIASCRNQAAACEGEAGMPLPPPGIPHAPALSAP